MCRSAVAERLVTQHPGREYATGTRRSRTSDSARASQNLTARAGDADLALNISEVQITSLGGRRIVAYFQN